MIKINMGCGWRNFGKEWIHIDGGDYSHLDSKNIFNLEFEKDSVDLIYSSHVVEYFDKKDATKLLKEWHRVLKPGATLRIAVPDFEAMSKLYTSKKVNIDQILGPVYGIMKMGDMSIQHKTAYDFKKIKDLLTGLGFKDVEKYDWRKTCHANHDDHSQAYIPHMDKDNGNLISLNVECKK